MTGQRCRTRPLKNHMAFLEPVNISNTQVPMKTVDIGLAQLAMHSVYETTGAKDTESLVKAATVFFA